MKSINVELSNDQIEALEYISNLCEKAPSEFIKEALICLLPLNEYIEIKRNLIEIQDEKNLSRAQEEIHKLNEKIENVNASTNHRLKRFGII